MKVCSLPVWVVTGIERPAIDVELVAEDELILLPICVRRYCICVVRRIFVDEGPISGHDGQLPALIDTAEVVTPVRALGGFREGLDDGKSSTGRDVSYQDVMSKELDTSPHNRVSKARERMAMQPRFITPRQENMAARSWWRSRFGSMVERIGEDSTGGTDSWFSIPGL